VKYPVQDRIGYRGSDGRVRMQLGKALNEAPEQRILLATEANAKDIQGVMTLQSRYAQTQLQS